MKETGNKKRKLYEKNNVNCNPETRTNLTPKCHMLRYEVYVL